MSNTPYVHGAVRAIGTLKPKFDPGTPGKVFSDHLSVFGTGFWLKEEKVLVTCAHVIQELINGPVEMAGLLVVGKAGQYKRAVIDVVDMGHDLATLKLVNTDGRPISDEELAAEAGTGLDLVSITPNVSTAVAYSGFPMGERLLNQVHDPSYSEGVISVNARLDQGRKQIQISGPVVGGFSGSPVVLKEDPTKLVGVVSNGPVVNGVAPGLFMAVSWEHVQKLAQLAAE